MRKELKKRNPIAMDMHLNGLYRAKVFKNRKKEIGKFNYNKFMRTESY